MALSAWRVHFAFALSLVLVAALAAATGAGTSGPWYSSAVAIEVYGLSLLASILVSLGLAAFAAWRVDRADDALRRLELRIAGIPEAEGMPSPREITPEDLERIPPSDAEVDELLSVLHAPSGAPVAELEITGTLMDVETAITASKMRKEILKAAVRQRSDLLQERASARSYVAGPILASLVVTAMSGAMLLGAEGFAARNFQLNTSVLLFLAYGWMFLVAWAVAAIAASHARHG